MSAQKERPIIFNGNMVQAILNGSKSQTRRVIKPQPPDKYPFPFLSGSRVLWSEVKAGDYPMWNFFSQCPYGQVGDRLWVRETFVLESTEGYGYADPNFKIPTDRPTKYIPRDDIGEYEDYYLIPHYRATEPEPNIVRESQDSYDDTTKWSPSIHMPRWASRITLEITEVRVERVQEITEADVKAEGIPSFTLAKGVLANKPPDPRWKFIDLWDSLNAKRGYGWDFNPWEWPISFKEVKGES